MNLHENKYDFAELIRQAGLYFDISPTFIEKDYWITRSLQRLSQNADTEKVVFKGGTSLAKAFRLTKRFSEDIDIAVIDADSFSGNQLKMLIKRLAKDIASDMEETIVPGVTSKGSRFYKAVYTYPTIIAPESSSAVKSGQLLIEINTYANPYPYIKKTITSFISDFLISTNRLETIEQYEFHPFELNVLDKRRTMVEKLISLIRFSFSVNPATALSAKIRHFYDLFYLANDLECAAFIQSSDFQNDLSELFAHDQQEFDEPIGWQTKTVADSPLVTDFPEIWKNIRSTYQNELMKLAFSPIPDEKLIAESFWKIMNH